MRVLIDANVPLNVWLADRPMARESEEVLRAVGNGRLHGCMTPSLMLFVLVTLQHARGPEEVEARGNELLDIITIIAQPKGAFRATISDRWKDLEDGFQYYAAKRHVHPIVAIITNNTKDFKPAKGLEVLDPAAFVEKYLR